MTALHHLYERAVQFSIEGKEEDAQQLYRAVLADDPGNQDVWLEYGQLLTDQQRVLVFQHALAFYPDMPKVRQELVRLNQNHNGNGYHAHQRKKRLPKKLPHWLWIPIIFMEVLALVMLGQIVSQRSRASILTKQIAGLQQELIASGVQLEQTKAELKEVQAKYAELEKRYKNLADTFNSVLADLKKVRGAYIKLEARYKELKEKHQDLQTRFQTLTNEFQQLTGEKDALQAQYDDLSSRYANLQTQYDDLSGSYNALLERNQALENRVAELEAEIIRLKNNPASYIRIKDGVATLTFNKTDGSTITWNIPFDRMESDIIRGHDARATIIAPFMWTNLTGPQGERYGVVDFTRFVDPAALKPLAEDLYNSAPDDEAFLDEVWNIMRQLSSHPDESLRTPRYPLETLLEGGGDSDDIAVLYASIIRAACPDWKMGIFYMNTDNSKELIRPNHVLVSIKIDSWEHKLNPAGENLDEFDDAKGFGLKIR